ncbi:MAG: cytochrome c oxidase accessory protein CcoG [SAR324 cluster bacterium]|nr:cytochrome c oxidase accessory protein CcoG [SAR324 cluster bacterium]
MAGQESLFVTKRYGVFALITLMVFAVPFIHIGEYHLLLLSFDQGRFELLGANFDSQELYFIPLLLIFGLVFLFFLTSLGGRIWCGWFCPQTIFRSLFRDAIQGKLLGLTKWAYKDRPAKSGTPFEKLRLGISYLLLFAIVALASGNILWYFVTPENFAHAFLQPKDHEILIGLWAGFTLFLWLDIGFWGESFCAVACPYARVQSVLFDEDTLLVLYDEKRGNNSDGSMGNRNHQKQKDDSGDCIGCDLCVKVCPAKIDIRQGLQLACIECLECVDACAPIMAKKGKENLIRWASGTSLQGEKFKLLRARTIVYFLVMLSFVGIMVSLSGDQTKVLANLNRATGLYSIKADRVENHYILLLTNKQSQDQRVEVQVKGHKEIYIGRPARSFNLKSKGRVKKVIVLVTNSNLNPKGQKDLSLPIEIVITGPNGAELNKIKSIFIVPSASELKEKR